MPNTYLNPDSVFKPRLDAYTMAITSTGGKMIHVAGVTGKDVNRNFVGDGGMAAQVRCAMDNIMKILAEAGAGPEDVVRMNVYTTDMEKYLEVIKLADEDIAKTYYPAGKRPAGVLLGVTALAPEGCFVEIDATAVID